jgi:thiosulfate reductase cytochrome b subunit
MSEGNALIYRHRLVARLTHWVWAVAMFFLLLSGLQIFNAHPALYIGEQSGFEFDNDVLRIGAERAEDGTPVGYTQVFGARFDTTGTLGLSEDRGQLQARAFPAWATIPSYRSLATGRVVHFFFAWIFVAAFGFWLIAALLNGHLRREIIPTLADLRAVPQSIWDHLRLRLHHDGRNNVLQKLAYAAVLLVLFPLIILTGLTMSPSMDAAWPWLPEVFGGRQTARTLHFLAMALLVLFFLVHIAMVILAGPLNELRSMITGWYRTKPETQP